MKLKKYRTGILCISAFLAANSAWAATITVGPLGADHITIQAAIDAASDGDTITVAAGSYAEGLLVDKPLSLVGPNVSVSAVTGSRSPEAVLTERIRISANNGVTISGFEFLEVAAPTTWTIYIQGNSDNFTFENNRFIKNEKDAIRSGDTSLTGNITVSGNLIEGISNPSGTGIRLGGIYGSSTISNNSINLEFNGTPTGYSGIMTPSATNLTISGNNISNATNQGLQLAGICSDVIISNNLISNTNTSGGGDKGAIRLYGSDFTGPITITGNTLTDSFNGISVKDGQNITGKIITVQNNDLSGNSNSGVYNGATSGTLDATNNYWGSISGPSQADISGNVVALPYFTSATFTEAGPVRISATPTQGYATIQAAVDAANAGQTIEVEPNIYNESLAISKSITLSGPNVGIAGTGTRLPEAVVEGRISVNSADNVTIDGLKVTGPTEAIGIYGKYSSGLTVKNNVIDSINTGSSGSANGVYILNSNTPISDIEISGNLISNIGSSSATVSVKGIYFGDSTGTSTISNVLIENNTIQEVSVTGKGAYGILLNYGTNSTGKLSGVQVRDNFISGLSGAWAHAIGMETNTESATVSGNVISGLAVAGSNEIGIYFEQNPSAQSAVVRKNSFSADTNFGVAVSPGNSGVDATENYWGHENGPAGAGAKAGPGVDFSPWYSDAAFTNLRSAPVNSVITGTETYTDLFVPAGTTLTVSPDGSLTAEQLELADGATLEVIEGSLSLGEGSVISGSFTIFNSFGSWNVNGNTTFNISQSLALVSDIHVAAGKTLTVNGGGELILDGCVIDSQTPGTYSIVADADGVLTMARNSVTDAIIDINTLSSSVAANLVSRVYDNSFTNSTIEATDDAKVYHNLVDGLTTLNTDLTSAFDDVDDWGNVNSVVDLENKFTLDFDALDNVTFPGRTLDANGNLFVQTGDAIAMRMDISALGSNEITAAEALLGYNSNRMILTGSPTKVTPEATWEVLAETASVPSGLGLVDSALGLKITGAAGGVSANSTIAKVNFEAGSAGTTLGFFRVQTDRVFDGNGVLFKDTRLTKDDGVSASYLSGFTANSGELVVDNLPPLIDLNSVTATQVQPSALAPVDVIAPMAPGVANPVFRNGTPSILTFQATDNGQGLSGLDAADAYNDVIFTFNNGPVPNNVPGQYYSIVTTETGGVVTYEVSFKPLALNTLSPNTYVLRAKLQDRSGNVTANTILGSFVIANEAAVSVELQGFVGNTRDVTFVATGSGAPKTWTKTITNFNLVGVGNVVLEYVPAGTTSISAKTAWTLRSKVPATFNTSDPVGVAMASFTGSSLLKGGDITGDNVINTLDYSVLRSRWLTANTVADITGSGDTGQADYNLLRANFYTAGNPQ